MSARHSFTASLVLRRAGLLALVILALILLASARRAEPEAGQERSDQLAGALDLNHTLEQTFSAERDDLCAIDVFPRIPPGRLDSRYLLTLRLSEAGSPGEIYPPTDLAVQRVSLVEARSEERITFTFPPQPHSAGKTYRLRVETNAPADTVSLLSSSEDAYPGEALLQDGAPTGRDLTFRTYSALAPLALAKELSAGTAEFGWLLVFTLLAVTAGAALLDLLGAWPADGLAERGLWAAGVGAALVPPVYLVAGRYAGRVLAALALAALLRVAFHWKTTGRSPFQQPETGEKAHPSDWALPLLFLGALAVRLLQVRDIPAPMWVDGLSHIDMVQAILAAGRMPGGLLYHIGFHTQVALLHEITGLPLPRLIVLFGQWVSALSGPALYVLARRITNDTSAVAPGEAAPTRSHAERFALLAALVLAAFPSLPGYLINWGRYPFLLGLTLLPFGLAATMDALRQPPARAVPGRYLLCAVLLAGLFLSHYGMFSFWASFTLVFLVVERPAWLKQVRLGQVLLGGLLLLALGLLAGYLRFGDNLAGKIASTIAESRQVSEELDYASIWWINLRAGGLWLVIAGACGILWAALAKRKSLFLAGGWFLGQAVLVAVQSPILGFALASYANLLLALPLPLAVFAGGLLETLLNPAAKPGPAKLRRGEPAAPHPTRWSAAWRISATALLAAAGGLTQVGILNPTTLLYGPQDARAMEWIRANIPPQARLLINSRIWSNAQIVPADGGGWVETITGRETVFVEDRAQINSLEAFLQQEKVGYIYLGRSSGLLSRRMFEEAPERYQRVYTQAGIEIFAVRQK